MITVRLYFSHNKSPTSAVEFVFLYPVKSEKGRDMVGYKNAAAFSS